MHFRVAKSTRVLAVAGIAAVSTLGFGSTGAEARVPPPILQVDGGTSSALNNDGSATVTGPAELFLRHSGPHPVTVTATLVAEDGTLPEPENCEPAKAKFVITGDAADQLDEAREAAAMCAASSRSRRPRS